MTARHPDAASTTIGDDGYPANTHYRCAGRRVWEIDEDGDRGPTPVAEGHGDIALAALREHIGDPPDSPLAAADAWAVWTSVCRDCPGAAAEDGDGCQGSCECGGQLAPCGDDWVWMVVRTSSPDEPGAVPVTWLEARR